MGKRIEKERLVVGANSDKEAMVKIMRHLDDGYVLTQVNLCRPGCPAVVHLHFKKEQADA